jgi:hypothetical protein
MPLHESREKQGMGYQSDMLFLCGLMKGSKKGCDHHSKMISEILLRQIFSGRCFDKENKQYQMNGNRKTYKHLFVVNLKV